VIGIGVHHPVPHPCQNYGGGFSEAGGDVDQLGLANRPGPEGIRLFRIGLRSARKERWHW